MSTSNDAVTAPITTPVRAPIRKSRRGPPPISPPVEAFTVLAVNAAIAGIAIYLPT